jgi:hypothetical protein
MESDMKRLNKGIPAAVLMNSGYHSNVLAGEFDAILNGWVKAVTPFSQPKRLVSGRYEDGHWVELRLVWSEADGRYKIDPKAYEAHGRKLTMTEAKLAVSDARLRTPVELRYHFEAVIEEFDGGYDWDWKHRRVLMVEKWENGQWVTRRQVWNEATRCYELEGTK